MKIKITDKSYEEVLALPQEKHKKPQRPNLFFRTLMKVVAQPDLRATRFSVEKVGMERLGKREPCLFLMNHSSFVDLEIVASLLYPRPFNIIATTDSFIGKRWLMHKIGCIPTKKFTTDTTLVRDMLHTVRRVKSSLVLFPEASYSFDGTATPLPDTIGRCIKMLSVPVVMIRTYGAFSRDPLYNNLQRRKGVKVSAKMEYLLSPEEIAALSPEAIQEKVNAQFSFDHFRWQQENGVKIDAPFRADCLNRVLYKCPACQAEGQTEGKGILLRCHACKKEYFLTEEGRLQALSGTTEFDHIPDWYRWQREAVRREAEAGTYRTDLDVDILMTVDTKHLYRVGTGHLTHDCEGFHLVGCDGKLDYRQPSAVSYSLYSDFNWYEVGDMVCIGNQKALYYCFPREKGDIVAKLRLATEEIYKLTQEKKAAAEQTAAR